MTTATAVPTLLDLAASALDGGGPANSDDFYADARSVLLVVADWVATQPAAATPETIAAMLRQQAGPGGPLAP